MYKYAKVIFLNNSSFIQENMISTTYLKLNILKVVYFKFTN